MEIFEKYLNKLPIIPEVASKILSISDNNLEFSFKNLDDIISVDPMLTSRILKVANSALFSRQKEITTLQMAIGLLGFKNIKSLVLLLTASQFSKKLQNDDFYINFWKHSIVTAFISREIYTIKKDRANQDTAFILGLLHDIGRVALYNADPVEYKKILEYAANNKINLISVERDFIKSDHQEIGAMVMQHWNLPEIFVETAREHGNMNIFSRNKKIIRSISIADIIADRLGYGSLEDYENNMLEIIQPETDLSSEDLDYLLKEYQAIMEQDPLFKECENLFLMDIK